MTRKQDSENPRQNRRWPRLPGSQQDRPQCGRPQKPKDTLLTDAGFDQVETLCLTLARLFFVTFATPASQSWMRAFQEAEQALPDLDGRSIGFQVLDVLKAIRSSRRSVFMYSNPDCPGCQRIVTEHEFRLISALSALRRDQKQYAQMQLMLLCEGNPTGVALSRMAQLARALPCVESPTSAAQGPRLHS
jgi:hypothetical protein